MNHVQPHDPTFKTMALDNQIKGLADFEDLNTDLGLAGNAGVASDLVSAAGIQGIDVDVDAAATISTTSTAKSTATASNVSSDSASVASVDFNSGLQAGAIDNSIGVKSDAGLSGIAGTTVNASASTSKGDALSYAEINNSAGITDISDLTVGGELNALGKAVNTITSSSETVVGSAEAGSNLSVAQLGFDAAQIGVSSDATIQGLAQLTNSATAAGTSGGDSLAEAFAADLTGASLDGLQVGGVASVAGQTSFGNTSKATNVDGNAIAESDLATATGLTATARQLADADAGIDVSSDATITGLSAITSSATAATTDGMADADSNGGTIQGIAIADADIGGVASITGQSSFTGAAKSSNVTGDDSTADSALKAVGGLDAADLVNVASDATLKGLSNINLSATAESTGSAAVPTSAEATFTGGVTATESLTGASLEQVEIGGIGNIAGQVGFTGAANASNVTGDATAIGELFKSQGLELEDDASDTGYIQSIASDGTIQGIASLTGSATAATSNGLADAALRGGEILGANLDGELNIGGVGSITGQSSFTGAAKSSNVLGDDSMAGAQLTSVGGLDAAELINVASDATLKGLSSINMSAMAESTGAAGQGGETLASAGFEVGTVNPNTGVATGGLTGASLDEVTIGGIGNVLGQVGFTGAASASNVTGNADATGDLVSAMGLETDGTMTVSSDGTLKGLTSVTGSATAATTAGDANAEALAGAINGADFGDIVDIGGVGSIQGAANFNLSAKSTNVTGDPASGNNPLATGYVPADSSSATAGDTDLSAVGLQSIEGLGSIGAPDEFGINVASDATLSGTAIGSLKAEAFSTATNADSLVGNGADLFGAQIGDLNVGGIASVTGAAQLTGNGTASSVDGISKAETGLGATVTGLEANLFDVASDASITAQAFGTLNATATSIGAAATATAGDESTKLTGLADELDLNIGGVGTLNALAQGSENASATSVAGIATASAGMDLSGAIGLDFASSSDGSLTSMAKLVATASASSTGAGASANGDFSAIGFDGLAIGDLLSLDTDSTVHTDVVGIGGVSTLKGQAQVTGTLTAESVSGPADAGMNEAMSFITGMNDVVLNGASDGTILGTASGVFNTTATSIDGDASGFSAQTLKGISTLDLNLGGNGTINAIVNDQNFVTAHSVSGNASAMASVDAVGLEGGSIHIAGNATIMANVGVDSKAEAHTVG